MVQAPVGWHCHQCVRRSARLAGGPVPAGLPGRPGARQAPVTMTLLVVNVVLFLAAAARKAHRRQPDGPCLHAEFRPAGPPLRILLRHQQTSSTSPSTCGAYTSSDGLWSPSWARWRYIALYLLSGLGGSVAYYLIGNPFMPAAGASGAIFGLFGAYFVLARRASANTSGIIALIAINLLFSFTVPDIAWQAHVGGLATGLVVAGGLSLARRGRRKQLLVAGVVLATTAASRLLLLLAPGAVNLG
jgi:hypothetical protein